MTVLCAECEHVIKEGEDAIAVVRTQIHDIPSRRTYAIEKPTECLMLFHALCWDPGIEDIPPADDLTSPAEEDLN